MNGRNLGIGAVVGVLFLVMLFAVAAAGGGMGIGCVRLSPGDAGGGETLAAALAGHVVAVSEIVGGGAAFNEPAEENQAPGALFIGELSEGPCRFAP